MRSIASFEGWGVSMSTPDRPGGDGSRRAVALGYRRGQDDAPRVVAHGRGAVAARLLDVARSHGIPVRQDEDLLTCLEPLHVGERIPAESYEVVARILAFVYRLNAELSGERSLWSESDSGPEA